MNSNFLLLKRNLKPTFRCKAARRIDRVGIGKQFFGINLFLVRFKSDQRESLSRINNVLLLDERCVVISQQS